MNTRRDSQAPADVRREGTANPINPSGVKRGAAKKDVYRELDRLDYHGADVFEAIALGTRFADEPPSAEELLALFEDAEAAPKLIGKDRAYLLERRKKHLEYVAKINAADEDLRIREKHEALVLFVQPMTAEEELALKDLRRVHLCAIRYPQHYREAVAQARIDFKNDEGREPREIPQRLQTLARRILAKRRRRERREAVSFDKQLGNLTVHSDKGRTIADWIRMGREQGLLAPKLPSRRRSVDK